MSNYIERIRENIARRLVWWAKRIEPGNGRMMDARQGWYVDFKWVQPVSKHDTEERR